MAPTKKATGGLEPGDVASLFRSLQAAARKFARGDSSLAEDLVASAWVRIVEVRNRRYKLAQFHVVGLNAMRRALRAEIRHRTGCTPFRRDRCRVPMVDDLAVESTDLLSVRDQVAAVMRNATGTARVIFEHFLVNPNTLPSAARDAGLSAATACRAAAKIRQLLPECGPGQ